MDVLVLKLNGWVDLFEERIHALSESVDELVLFRPCPDADSNEFDGTNVTVYNLYPRREAYLPPKLHAIVLPIHVLQAVILGLGLVLTKRIRPDVIHALDYVLGGLVGGILSKTLSIPLVLSVRGLAEPRYQEIANNNSGYIFKFNFQVVKLLPRIIFPLGDHIITKAEYQQEFVRRKYGVDPGFTTIPTGVDFNKFNCESTDQQGELVSALSEDTTLLSSEFATILYLGKVTPEKGLDDLLELVAATDEELPEDVRFEIIGDVRSESFGAEVQQKAEKLGDRVVYSPRAIPFDVVPSAICASDAIILLSTPRHEGTPRILQEACAAGRPIIASDVEGIRGAFAGRPGCNLIDVDDESAFKNAVESVRESPNIDREVFRDDFDLYRNYGRYRGVYESVIEKHGETQGILSE